MILKNIYNFFLKNIIIKIFQKKVLLVSHALDYTGAPLFLLRTARVLKKEGYKIILISLKDGPLSCEFRKLGKVFININKNQLTLLAKCSSFSIVSTIIPYTEYGILKKIIPTCWWIQEPPTLVDFPIKRMIEKADVLYTMSQYNRLQYLKYNPLIRVIKHAYPDCYRGKEINITHLKFAIIGSISERKGTDIFISAVNRLPQPLLENVEFIILGHLDNLLYRQLKRIKSKSITFLDRKTSFQDMLTFYEGISCVVVPSVEEPTSLCVIESMMMGRPVIISDHVGAKYLVNSKNGFVFHSQNITELSNIFKKIIKNPERLKSMSNYARQAFLEHNTMDLFRLNLKDLILYTKQIFYATIQAQKKQIKFKSIQLFKNKNGLKFIGNGWNMYSFLNYNNKMILIPKNWNEDYFIKLKSLTTFLSDKVCFQIPRDVEKKRYNHTNYIQYTPVPGEVLRWESEMTKMTLEGLCDAIISLHSVDIGNLSLKEHYPASLDSDELIIKILSPYFEDTELEKIMVIYHGILQDFSNETDLVLIHGDLKGTNIIQNRGKIIGFIDWENASLSEREAEFSCIDHKEILDDLIKLYEMKTKIKLDRNKIKKYNYFYNLKHSYWAAQKKCFSSFEKKFFMHLRDDIKDILPLLNKKLYNKG